MHLSIHSNAEWTYFTQTKTPVGSLYVRLPSFFSQSELKDLKDLNDII